jgi:predicted CXXCH cytochrome family protein
VTKGRKQAHGPVASGNCAACHNAHTSEFPKLLVNEGRALCLGCHKEMAQQMQKVKSLHKPVEGDCLQCHEAHASSQIKQLKAAPLDLCVSCHAPIKKMAQEAAFKHSAVTEGQACLNCHTSHGSDLAKLMKSEPAAACLACHDKAITRPGATVVAAVTEISQPGLFKHGPIRDGNCSGCHTPHGGPLPRLLSQPYPETFYQPFKVDAYALCFSCHDKQLVLAQQTEGLTRFRNGTLNLHYVHVNKPERGRSCYSCHSTHASALPSHVRESVPYGNWEIPLNFKTTATGGSCAPGCHRAVAYDRQNAAANLADVPPAPGPVAPPAAQPAPPAGPLPAPSAPSAAVPSGVTSGAEKKDEEKKP